jgi:hypothetical protein
MFVIDNKVITYPSRKIIVDMLSRTGPADEFSFTPWDGCADEMGKQFNQFYKDLAITVDDIAAVSSDFMPSKMRPNDDGVAREESAYEISDYATRLEDIDREWVMKYIVDILIGYKRNNNGITSRNNDEATMELYYDDEDNSYIEVSDLVEKEIEFTTEEVIEAQTKLPYLLKQLHDGSKRYGGSLLSFIIAAERILSHNGVIKPQNLVRIGVWRMNKKGYITTPFVESDNTNPTLRNLVAWICERDTTPVGKMYYNIYKELIRVLAILDVDIREESALDYDESVIDKIVCTYIASNEEFIETYGSVDMNILNAIGPDKIFEVARQYSENPIMDDEKISWLQLADSLAVNIEAMYVPNGKWTYKPQLVSNFMTEYVARHTNTTYNSRKFEIDKGLIKHQSGEYQRFDISDITDNYNDRVALLAASGVLVKLKNFDFEIEVLNVNDAIDSYKRGVKHEWSTIKFWN